MIVVVGALGSTGSAAVEQLLARNRPVRAVVRDLARARARLPAAAELVVADVGDRNSHARILDGATGIYCAIGGPGGSTELIDIECAFIDAAQRAGVRHYVKVSGMDSTPDAPTVIQRWHGTIEQHLRASSLPETVLRPTFFMQNFLGLAPAIQQGVLPLPTGSARCALIDARDIGEVAAHVLTSEGHAGRTYTLTGPESLDHSAAAAILSHVLERPVQFVDLPGPAFEANLVAAGLPAWFAALLTDVYVAGFAPGHLERRTDDVQSLLGRAPRTLAQFARDHRSLLAG